MKKSKTRIFINKTISQNLLIYIKGKQFHFLKNVLRSSINDKINLFDGTTGEWDSTIISINRDTIILKVINNINTIIKSNDVWLIFAPIKQYRMNIAIQKATELGVSRIIPCITEYTNVRKINVKNLLDNAIEASEQSERNDIPKIEKEIEFSKLILDWPEDRLLIFCDEKENTNTGIIKKLTPLKNYLNKSAILIGPEGGFSENEREMLLNKDKVIPVSLGNRLLRSDTAIAVSLFSIEQLLV
tara:strand:+ start:623 stop:1354 length:732 start_codon:yes stop_codon:yes gene_type:complete